MKTFVGKVRRTVLLQQHPCLPMQIARGTNLASQLVAGDFRQSQQDHPGRRGPVDGRAQVQEEAAADLQVHGARREQRLPHGGCRADTHFQASPATVACLQASHPHAAPPMHYVACGRVASPWHACSWMRCRQVLQMLYCVSRPLSKNKTWRMTDILQREKVYDAEAVSRVAQHDQQPPAGASLPAGAQMAAAPAARQRAPLSMGFAASGAMT